MVSRYPVSHPFHFSRSFLPAKRYFFFFKAPAIRLLFFLLRSVRSVAPPAADHPQNGTGKLASCCSDISRSPDHRKPYAMALNRGSSLSRQTKKNSNKKMSRMGRYRVLTHSNSDLWSRPLRLHFQPRAFQHCLFTTHSKWITLQIK